jgi:hypothetical protein
MSELAQTTRQLEEAVEALKLATALCYASSQYKAMIDAENKYNQLSKQLWKLHEEKIENEYQLNKQILIDLGFECRISESYYIVHENTPQLPFDNIEYLSSHFSEMIAWTRAYEKWSSLTIDEQNELIR